ncbi:5-carboxymethyl-2-hydroxymuconate Delta-isomerase [Maribacter sp. HTCC2170]|uniref:5-carboxymethyl-2-hydroxymuconate Delta-isomerase n=1 Tax=Maribacter sp. (strain HTCC2170 / KCCM 42371) TaxID=313603 RepID=UPI00006B2108|nr:5-carboxymethyl-2-hydroxymuconate Delta-isomerase [Maribacter sp. HTCC2170]EAR00064.1 putative 5-carboxymethyl-2-hydroxymuconate delta-isomerase [Maribacter sp. HTCC2170]
MPHFVLECSENVLEIKSPQEIMQKVYDSAESIGLFAKGDIKVRINPYQYYKVGGTNDKFVHVFANIMEGRSTEQKNKLSNSIVSELNEMLPNVPIISINIRDFERATYCNKSMF